MNKTGFIFDLDGVLVDTAKYHYMAWKKLAEELGFEFTEAQNELFKGVSRKRCLEILLEIGDIDATEAQFNNWMHQKNMDYLEYIDGMDESEILPNVLSSINHLAANKIPMALGSASKNAEPILEKVHLKDYFMAVIDGNKVTHAKPDPEVFLMAAAAINRQAANCVVFEDAVAGIEAANRAGMISIGIGDKEVLKGAAYNFKDFSEITTEVLDEINAKASGRNTHERTKEYE